MKNRIKVLVSFLVLTLVLVGCGSSNAESSENDGLMSDGILTVGVTAGPHAELTNKVKELAAEDGFEIEVVTFNDFVKPNSALVEGSLDVNSFQTKPYLENVNAENGYNLQIASPTISMPMGLYSQHYGSVDELQEGDTVAIPNSPTQNGRALQVIEDAGLITLPEESGLEVTIDDIIENPLNLNFIASEAAQLPRQLPDVDLAAINSNYMLDAGYNPSKDALFIENTDDLAQVNNIVTRPENIEDPAVQQFIDYYHSEEIKQYIENHFKGGVIPSW